MHEYQFVLEKDQSKIPAGSSLICWIDVEPVLVYGKLRRLFGEPTYETLSLENQYCYCLSAKDESGRELCIYAYNGSSGPAVGGLHTKESGLAAEQLLKMIQSAPTADYSYEGYYLDGSSKISMGIKDGIPFFSEEECEEIPDLW